MIKLCIAGVCGHYSYVLKDLPDLPDVKLVGICAIAVEDHVDNLIKWVAENEHTPEIFADYCEMLDSVSPDIVTVSGPFDQHASMSIAALERNINVFCEKPVALTLADLNKVEAAWIGSKACFSSMTGLRFDPYFYTARQLVRQGKIGKVKLIHAQKSYKLGNRPDYYRSRKTYGGTIPWVGIHAIDWIYWFADADFKSVTAQHTTIDNNDHGELEISAVCQFELDNGIMATANIDYLRPDSAPTHGDDRIRVVGTKGIVEVQNGSVTILSNQSPQAENVTLLSTPGIFSSFVDQTNGKHNECPDGKQTITVTRACLLARQAADNGRKVIF